MELESISMVTCIIFDPSAALFRFFPMELYKYIMLNAQDVYCVTYWILKIRTEMFINTELIK